MIESFNPDLILAEINTRLVSNYTDVPTALIAFFQDALSSSSTVLPDLENAWLANVTGETGTTPDLLKIHVGPATTVAEGAQLGPNTWVDATAINTGGWSLTDGIWSIVNGASLSLVGQNSASSGIGKRVQFIVDVLSVSGNGQLVNRVRTSVLGPALTVGINTVELTADEANAFVYPLFISGGTATSAEARIVSVREVIPRELPINDRAQSLLTSQTFFE